MNTDNKSCHDVKQNYKYFKYGIFASSVTGCHKPHCLTSFCVHRERGKEKNDKIFYYKRLCNVWCQCARLCSTAKVVHKGTENKVTLAERTSPHTSDQCRGTERNSRLISPCTCNLLFTDGHRSRVAPLSWVSFIFTAFYGNEVMCRVWTIQMWRSFFRLILVVKENLISSAGDAGYSHF